LICKKMASEGDDKMQQNVEKKLELCDDVDERSLAKSDPTEQEITTKAVSKESLESLHDNCRDSSTKIYASCALFTSNKTDTLVDGKIDTTAFETAPERREKFEIIRLENDKMEPAHSVDSTHPNSIETSDAEIPIKSTEVAAASVIISRDKHGLLLHDRNIEVINAAENVEDNFHPPKKSKRAILMAETSSEESDHKELFDTVAYAGAIDSLNYQRRAFAIDSDVSSALVPSKRIISKPDEKIETTKVEVDRSSVIFTPSRYKDDQPSDNMVEEDTMQQITAEGTTEIKTLSLAKICSFRGGVYNRYYTCIRWTRFRRSK